MKLKICGRFEVLDFAGQGFTHMISIGDSNDYFEGLRLPEIDPARYLILRFTDTEDSRQRDAPSLAGMMPLLSWLEEQISVSGLLVHCAGGISRSPAVALLSMCYFLPDTDPFRMMAEVARSARCSYIWPNQRVIELGDQLLERKGQIVAAVRRWKEEKDQSAVEFL